uniref:Major tail protein n=1 Tax=Firmicutes phage HS10 TaxID=3056392 RepID=A0AA49X3F9_9VIRU|nr:MAG: major tail protein [Firmicutes phage HS10]
MAQAKKGKKIVLLWRLLKDAKTKDGGLMMFQTEHSVEKSRDSDSVVTKTGTIRNLGALEEEVPFTSLCATDDPVLDYLNTAIDEGEELELWEVDMNMEANAGKYPAKYRRGYLSKLSYTANAEDNVEVEGTFATEMQAQKGEVALTLSQTEAAQYQFRGTEKVTQ